MNALSITHPLFCSHICSQNPLRANHLPLSAPHPRTRLPHRQRQRLERTLRAVMIIVPPQHIHVQRHARLHAPAAQAVVDHLRVQRAEHRAREAEVAVEERPVREVDDGAREGFVQGRVGAAEAVEAEACAEGGGEGGAEGEEGVFGGVVVVDWRSGGG